MISDGVSGSLTDALLIVAVITAVSALVWKMAKGARRLVHLVDQVEQTLSQPNGGHSVRDVLNRLEVNQAAIIDRLDALERGDG
jgi:hypothetical protein